VIGLGKTIYYYNSIVLLLRAAIDDNNSKGQRDERIEIEVPT